MTHARENEGAIGRGVAPAGGARGLTLIELLVVTGVLSALILVVSTMLTQSQRAIQISQTAIRAGADVRAVLAHIRRDVSTVSKDGFLIICTPVQTVNMTPMISDHLVLTSVGRYQSLMDATTANAARIDYGITSLEDGKPEGPERTLWRRAILLDPGTAQKDDHEKMALSYYLANAIYWRSSGSSPPRGLYFRWMLCLNLLGDYEMQYPDGSTGMMPWMIREPQFKLPITTLADLDANWALMLSKVKHLYVQWTDGQPDAAGNLRWYGRGSSPRDTAWTEKSPTTDEEDAQAGRNLPEFNIRKCKFPPVTPPKDGYAAMWTCRNKTNWPKALRIELELTDPPQLFEVVVALPK